MCVCVWGRGHNQTMQTALSQSRHSWKKGAAIEQMSEKTNLKVIALLVCQDCHNKVWQTERLRTREIYSLPVAEAGSPKLKVSADVISPQSLRKDSSLPLPASGSLGPSMACDGITPVSASVFPWPSFLCVCVYTRHSCSLYGSMSKVLSFD